MGGFIKQKQWDVFAKQQNKSHKDYMTKDVIWQRSKGYNAAYNEDYSDAATPTDTGYYYLELKALCNYNYQRTWQSTKDGESGDLDRQTVQVFLSIAMLRAAGYLDSANNFNYNPGADRFIIDNKVYRYAGDDPAGQTINNDQLTYAIVLKPDAKATGTLIRAITLSTPTPPATSRYAVCPITVEIKTSPLAFDANNPATYILLRTGTKIAKQYPVGNTLTIPYLNNKFVYPETLLYNYRPEFIPYADTVFTRAAEYGGFGNDDIIQFLYEDIIST